MVYQDLPQVVKVRFAPSPTGIPHIGTIRTALYNYFFAKANNGKFILRIEDTDQARLVEGAEDAIKESLSWLSIEWDEYIVQSKQLADYKKYAEELVSKGRAKKEDGGALRFITPTEGVTSWIDKVGNKKVEFANKDIEDFIILKSDGFPTYHLANVIDDNKEGITHVIRGEDWISSTPKHILLYEAFGFKHPEFVHVPNVLGSDGKTKLSKRKGAKGVLDFKNEGFLSEALLNYLVLLGWSPKDDREILEKKEIIKEFSLDKLNVSPAAFDQKKLEWMNGMYIRQLSVKDLKIKLVEFYSEDSEVLNVLKNNNSISENFLIGLAQTRMKTLLDFKSLAINSMPAEVKPEYKTLADKLIKVYKTIEWEPALISGATIAVRDQLNAGTADVYTVLTGKSSGLPFEQKAFAQGKEGTIEWLDKVASS